MNCLSGITNYANHVSSISAKTTNGKLIAEIGFLNGKPQINYKKKNENNEYYDFIDLQKLANRYSRKKIYLGRKFNSMNISCAASCLNDGLEEYVRFGNYDNTYHIGDDDSKHINEIIFIINNEKMERANNGLPMILLIPYNQDVGCCCFHSVVLVVDLSLFPEKKSIFIFDSAHFLIGKNGINVSGSFGNLALSIHRKALNESKWQFCLKTTCTFWSEAFIVIAAKFIKNNYDDNYSPKRNIERLIEFINSNKQEIACEKDRIIDTVGCWLIRWLPIWHWKSVNID